MATSRRGITGITLAVGLGVAVTTSQGVAHADSTDPGSPPGDPPSTTTTPSSTDGSASQGADGDAGGEQKQPSAKKRPRSLVDGTRITIRRDDAKPATKGAATSATKGDATSATDDADLPEQVPETIDEPKFEGAPGATKTPDIALPPGSAARALVTGRPRTLTVDVPNRGIFSALETKRSPEGGTATFADPAELETATSPQQRQSVSTFDMDRITVRHAPLTPSLRVDAAETVTAAVAGTAAQSRVVTDLFSALGLRPSPITPTRPVLPLPRLLELVFVAIRRTFFNETPTARLDEKTFEVNTTTGVATGQIVGSDPDGDRLTYRLKTPPAQGSVDVRPDGTFTYTPQDGWTHTTGGDVQFTIAVSDATYPHLHLFSGGGHETSYTVKFSYSGSNNAPVVAVTNGDVQPDGTVKYTVSTSDKDGDPVALTVNGVHGTLTGSLTSENGGVKQYDYTFTPDKKFAHDLTIGGETASGLGEAIFTVSDGLGGEDQESRAITINGVNSAPVMTVDPQAGGVYEITVVDDDGDAITLTPSVLNGTLDGGETTVKGTFKYTFTVDPEWQHDLTLPGKPGTGMATVGFVATDGHGGSSVPYSQNIDFVGTNDIPELTVTPLGDGVYDVVVMDADEGDVIALGPTVTNGTLTETKIDARHSVYTFTVDPKWQHDLTLPGQPGSGTATVSFVATDDHGGTSATNSQSINVVGTNDIPELTVTPLGDGKYDVVVADSDNDDVIAIRPTVTNGTLTETKIDARHSVYTFKVDPTYAHDLTRVGSNGTGTASVEFVATDDHQGISDKYHDDIDVIGVNAEPTVQVISGSTEIKRTDGIAEFTIKAVDADNDDAKITSVTAIPSPGTTTTVVQNADGSWKVTYRANYDDAHKLGPTGVAFVPIVTVAMTDGHAAEPTTQQVSAKLVGLNREPTLATDPTVNRATGVVSGTAVWTDRDDDDTLKNFTATVSNPAKGQLAYDPATGNYTFTPTLDARKAAEVVGAPIDDRRVIVTFTVSDEFGPHSEDVSVLIAPRDNQVLGSFPSDVRSSTLDRADSVVVSPDGTMVFVSNERSGLITRINAQTGVIEQTYNVGDINGNGSTRQLVVSQSTTNPAVYALDDEGRLWKIDGASDWDITGPPVTLPGTVGQIAVSNDGETVYFSSDDGRQARLRYLDTATMTVKPINTTPIVFLPRFVGPMVVDQETGFLVIDNGAVTAGYTVINPEDGTSPGKGAPIDILNFALNGEDMYALSPGGSTLQRLPITGGDHVTSSVVVTDGEKVVVAPDGERAYVLTNLNRVTVIEISRDGMRVVGNISIPGGTTDIAISPDGTHLYVTSVNDTVTFISISPGEAPEEPLPPSVL